VANPRHGTAMCRWLLPPVQPKLHKTLEPQGLGNHKTQWQAREAHAKQDRVLSEVIGQDA
jgi:hypothetical protein